MTCAGHSTPPGDLAAHGAGVVLVDSGRWCRSKNVLPQVHSPGGGLPQVPRCGTDQLASVGACGGVLRHHRERASEVSAASELSQFGIFSAEERFVVSTTHTPPYTGARVSYGSQGVLRIVCDIPRSSDRWCTRTPSRSSRFNRPEVVFDQEFERFPRRGRM